MFHSKKKYFYSYPVLTIKDGTPVIRTETNREEECRLDGEIRNKTILQAGMVSGKLTHHKGVTDINSCIKRCCEQDQCHVAMMMADKCYTVFCTNKQYCQPKPAPVETHHTNPTVAYVKRGEISFGNVYITVKPFLLSFELIVETGRSKGQSEQKLTSPLTNKYSR